MKTLKIEPTEFSPCVLLDAKRYWKDKRFDTKSAPVVFEFQFEYFNSTIEYCFAYLPL